MRRRRADGGEEHAGARPRRRRAQPLERLGERETARSAPGAERCGRGRVGQHGDGVGVEMGMRADPRQTASWRGRRRASAPRPPSATALCTSPRSSACSSPPAASKRLEQRPGLLAKPLGQRLEAARARRRGRRRSRAAPRAARRAACCAPAAARRRRAGRAACENGSSVTLSAPPRPAAKAASAARMTFTKGSAAVIMRHALDAARRIGAGVRPQACLDAAPEQPHGAEFRERRELVGVGGEAKFERRGVFERAEIGEARRTARRRVPAPACRRRRGRSARRRRRTARRSRAGAAPRPRFAAPSRPGRPRPRGRDDPADRVRKRCPR